MPQWYTSEESHRLAREQLKRRKAKLIAMGINPRGLKFIKMLYHR